MELGQEREQIAEAGRALEIFLDRLALLAAPTHSHLLDRGWRKLYKTREEKQVAKELLGVLGRLRHLQKDSATAAAAWGHVDKALRSFGAPE